MATTTRYTVMDGEILSENRGGTKRDYVPDALGSTLALLDNTQTQTDTFSYYPYGEVSSRTGTTATPFQYIGTLGYYQDNSGRTYVRARHLRTTHGRWMTQDPIGFAGGDFNLYRYVGNSPLTMLDFWGLQKTMNQCDEIARIISEVVNLIKKRHQDLLDDVHDLWTLSPGVHPDYGSWIGHQHQLEGALNRLRNHLIDWWNNCWDPKGYGPPAPIPADATQVSRCPIPQRPSPKPIVVPSWPGLMPSPGIPWKPIIIGGLLIGGIAFCWWNPVACAGIITVGGSLLSGPGRPVLNPIFGR